MRTDTDKTDNERAYAEQTAAIVRARMPLATIGLLASFSLAWIFEHRVHPERDLLYGVILSLEACACLLAIAVTRSRRISPAGVTATALLTALTIIVLVTSYHVAAPGEAEVLCIALSYMNVGMMLLFPWGGWGQSFVALASFGAYVTGILLGVPAAVPVELTVIGQGFIGILTCAGAAFMERHRRSFLRQEAALRQVNAALVGANEELQRQIGERQRTNDQLSALLDIARHISGTVDWQEVLDQVHERVARLMPCDRIATFSFDRDTRTFRVAAHYGVPEESRAAAEALQFAGEGAAAKELASGRRIVINDAAGQTWLPAALLEKFQIRALVAVPLQVRGRTVGVMTAARCGAAIAFTDEQVRWLEGVCQHLALARETASFYDAQREETRTAAGLARLASEMIASLSTPVILDRLCRLTADLLDCDCSHTFLLRDNVYVAVSGWGDSADEAESLAVLEVPSSVIEGEMQRLQHDTAAVIAGSPLAATAGAGRGELFIALRRGEDIVGIQTAGYRRRARHFSHWQVHVGRRIGEIASMALENARLFEQLGRANRLKSDFLATVSHEFRTPLNVILGYCDLLLEGAFGSLEVDQVDAVQRLRNNARQLLDLISATLDVSRLDGGKLPVQMQRVEVWNMVEEIDADTRDIRERKPQVQLLWKVPTNLPVLVTDRAKLKVILKNLIGNAIKFTDQGTVAVSVCTAGDGLEFAVSDTGIGVPREAQSAIFEAFRQADGSIVARYGGVGLGLYIVRRLADLLGGRVGLESEEGKGSTFRVWLPLQNAAPGDEPAYR